MSVVKTEVLNSADVWHVRAEPEEVRKGLDGGRIAPSWPGSEGVSDSGDNLPRNSGLLRGDSVPLFWTQLNPDVYFTESWFLDVLYWILTDEPLVASSCLDGVTVWAKLIATASCREALPKILTCPLLDLKVPQCRGHPPLLKYRMGWCLDLLMCQRIGILIQRLYGYEGDGGGGRADLKLDVA